VTVGEEEEGSSVREEAWVYYEKERNTAESVHISPQYTQMHRIKRQGRAIPSVTKNETGNWISPFLQRKSDCTKPTRP
jgi:hypothetical protein